MIKRLVGFRPASNDEYPFFTIKYLKGLGYQVDVFTSTKLYIGRASSDSCYSNHTVLVFPSIECSDKEESLIYMFNLCLSVVLV